MKKNILLLSLLATLLIIDCTGGNYDIHSAVSKEVILYTTVVSESATYRETSEYEIVKKFKRLFAREIILPVEVHIKTAIYCKDITDFEVDENTKTVTLTLPEPKIIYDGTRIDWDNCEVNIGTLRANFSAEEMEEFSEIAIKNCEDKVDKNKQQFFDMANINADKALTSMIESFGYRAVINY